MSNYESSFHSRLDTEFKKHQLIPIEVRVWIMKAVKEKKNFEILKTLEASPEDFIIRLDSFFEKMMQILNCQSERLVQGTDFNANDLDPERFDAMIAELRAVGFLHNETFTRIKLLPAPRKERGADIVAVYKGVSYAVEVVCSSRSVYRYPDHKRRSSDLTDWIVNKFQEKETQLKRTAEKQKCEKSTLVTVLNSYPAKSLLNRDGYSRVLREGWLTLDKPQDIHLAIVTGMITSGVGLDDCVYPAW